MIYVAYHHKEKSKARNTASRSCDNKPGQAGCAAAGCAANPELGFLPVRLNRSPRLAARLAFASVAVVPVQKLVESEVSRWSAVLKVVGSLDR